MKISKTIIIFFIFILFSCSLQTQKNINTHYNKRSSAIIKFDKIHYIKNICNGCEGIKNEDLNDIIKVVWITKDTFPEPFILQIIDIQTLESNFIRIYPTLNKKDIYHYSFDQCTYGNINYYNKK